MISFAKTIYNKLLRMGARFEGGVEFRHMEGFRGEVGEVFNVFDLVLELHKPNQVVSLVCVYLFTVRQSFLGLEQ